MILDTLDHSSRYLSLSPRLEKAFDFIRSVKPDAPAGKVSIDGTDLFALVQRPEGKAGRNQVFEAHRRYLDVQCLYRGREIIPWAPTSTLTATCDYVEGDDYQLFAPTKESTPLHLSPGAFVIFYPGDGHSPAGLSEDPHEPLFKVVVKLRL